MPEFINAVSTSLHWFFTWMLWPILTIQ